MNDQAHAVFPITLLHGVPTLTLPSNMSEENRMECIRRTLKNYPSLRIVTRTDSDDITMSFELLAVVKA